tara:strand:+ start:88 stop:906 length:819 start_codon:yes stop_codon:yes gene_type:complete
MLLGSVLNIGTPSDSTVTDAKANFVSTSSAAGLQIKGDGTTDGTLQLNCRVNSHGIKLKSPPHSAGQSYTLTFPSTAPATDKILQTNSSGVLSFVDAPSGSLVKITTSDISSTVSAVDLTSIFSSTHDVYKVILSDFKFDTDSVKLAYRSINSSGLMSGSSDYKWALTRRNSYESHSSNYAGTNNEVQLTGHTYGNASVETLGGVLELFHPLSTNRYKLGQGAVTNHDPNSQAMGTNVNWSTQTTNALTGFRIFATGGNMTAGKIVVYGYEK